MALDIEQQQQLMREAARAKEAKAILDSAIFKEALRELKDDIIAKWSECPARDVEGREWLWKLHQNSLKFEAILKNIVETGMMADTTLKQEGLIEQTARRVSNLWR